LHLYLFLLSKTPFVMNEASEKRKAAAVRKAAQRAKIKSSETEEEKVQRNLREAKRQAEYRAKETPQQTQIRLRKMAEQAETRRSIETPQQTQIRSKRNAEQAAIRRSIETPEQTIVRLENILHVLQSEGQLKQLRKVRLECSNIKLTMAKKNSKNIILDMINLQTYFINLVNLKIQKILRLQIPWMEPKLI